MRSRSASGSPAMWMGTRARSARPLTSLSIPLRLLGRHPCTKRRRRTGATHFAAARAIGALPAKDGSPRSRAVGHSRLTGAAALVEKPDLAAAQKVPAAVDHPAPGAVRPILLELHKQISALTTNLEAAAPVSIPVARNRILEMLSVVAMEGSAPSGKRRKASMLVPLPPISLSTLANSYRCSALILNTTRIRMGYRIGGNVNTI
jgi:hypothetical protein